METKTPNTVGIIMDGNRRWADSQGLRKLLGHNKGAEKLKQVAKWAREQGVKNLIVYAFSTENWKRNIEEVTHLMDLLRDFMRREEEYFLREGVRLRVVGERERLPADVQDAITSIEVKTAGNSELTLYVAISYGGRAEMLQAFNAFAARHSGSTLPVLTEDVFEKYLWTVDMPDPDIIIRTGGEMRLSNFLLWQSAYSELFFTPTFWPDFEQKEFNKILDDFEQRERRRGK